MSKKKKTKGFTLVELLLAMAATLIVVGALVAAFSIQNKYYTRQSEIVEIQEDARAGFQMMNSELMMAGYNPARISGTGILTADIDTIQFTQDLNGNGDVSAPHEDVTYGYDAPEKQLTRNTQPLAENIQSLAFRYFDEDGNELTPVPLDAADRENIRMIQITITAISRDGDRTRTLSSDVRPRNLGLSGSAAFPTPTPSPN